MTHLFQNAIWPPKKASIIAIKFFENKLVFKCTYSKSPLLQERLFDRKKFLKICKSLSFWAIWSHLWVPKNLKEFLDFLNTCKRYPNDFVWSKRDILGENIKICHFCPFF